MRKEVPTKPRPRIPAMPPNVRCLRFWPPKESIFVCGFPHDIDDPLPLIEETLARLDRKLRNPGSEAFSVEGLVHRLSLLGVLIEIDQPKRKKRRTKRNARRLDKSERTGAATP